MITDDEIHLLWDEAAEARDWDMCSLCCNALKGDAIALTECDKIAAEAKAETEYQR